MTEKKLRIVLPAGTSIIQYLRASGDAGGKGVEIVVEFDKNALESRNLNGFISDLFDQFLTLEASESEYFISKMIRILEEKGLKVRICGNCKFFRDVQYSMGIVASETNPRVICLKRSGVEKEDLSYRVSLEGCEQWEPKEVKVDLPRGRGCGAKQ